MNKANELADHIVGLMKNDADMKIDIVNDLTTEDSVVEHVTDMDVQSGKYLYNVSLTVIRFGKSQ